LLGKKNHSEDHYYSDPQQHVAKESAADRALLGVMLLPKSQAKHHHRKT
jgi:hypothetical protein